MSADETTIRRIIDDMCAIENGKLGGRSHHTDDCIFIRPTGNPLDMKGWDDMMNSPDVKVTSNELKEVHRVDICGDMAYAIYTSHGVFNFKGTDNDDIAVFSVVMKRINGTWKVVFGQRSSGRGPQEPLPNFNF